MARKKFIPKAKRKKTKVDLAPASKRDPTGTLTLRNQFVAEMTARFKWLKQMIRLAVEQDDVFGLMQQPSINYDPSQPRDEKGKWTSGGFGGGKAVDIRMTSRGGKEGANQEAMISASRSEHVRLTKQFKGLSNVPMEKVVFSSKTLHGAGARWDSATNTMIFNEKYSASDYARLDKKYRANRTVVSYTPDGVFRHEFGHAVYEKHLTAKQRNTVANEWMDMYMDDGAAAVKKHVSKYAAKNFKETFAEMFGDMTSRKPRLKMPKTFLPKTQAVLRGVLR